MIETEKKQRKLTSASRSYIKFKNTKNYTSNSVRYCQKTPKL